MLFWYTPQIAQFQHAAADATDQQTSALTAAARDSRHAVELAVSLSRPLKAPDIGTRAAASSNAT
jgi:hypothetical protein